MRVVGVDSSTWTGLARIDSDGSSMGKVVNFPKEKGMQRLQLIAQEVKRTLKIWAPDYAVMEGYAFGNTNTLVTLVECGTVCKLVLQELGIRWYTVPPTTLKKWTTGNGAASKDLMAANVKQRWGYSSSSDDIVDAYALAQMGMLGELQLSKIKGVVCEH